MKAYLGEICIASYAQNDDNKWLVNSPQAACNHILVNNEYLNENYAKEAVKRLVPEQCRNLIRFLPDVKDAKI